MKKLLVMVIILSLLSFSAPQKAKAQYVDVVNASKEFGFDTVAYIVAQTVLKKITARTVNWINSGFKGNPGYISDPGQFFLNVGDDLASQFLSQEGINKLCSPFRAEVRLALVKNYINENENYSCSLSLLRDNFEAFTQDFTQGGWDGWFEVTQNRQNNPLGTYLAAKNRLEIEIGKERKLYEDELTQSGGFLNFKRCPAGQERIIGANVFCNVREETVTPGTVINEQLGKSLGSAWTRLEAADEINEVVTALVVAMVEQLTGAVGGLRGASEIDPARGTSLVGAIAVDPQPVPVVNGPITATQPSLNCRATGGTGGSGGGGGDGGGDGGGGTGGSGGGGGVGGSVNCSTTPGTIGGMPPWPLGSGGSGGHCEPYTPDPSVDCTQVDAGWVLSVLEKYPPSNDGITDAIEEVRGRYPWAYVIPHARLDKIDFGNGMVVDVIIGAVPDGEGQGWTFNVECACNRNPAGSANPTPPVPLPGTGTYTVTVTINGLGQVTDGTDTCLSTTGTATCSKPYPRDQFVSITANAAVGRTFTGWGGACAPFGINPTCQGNLTADAVVTATFQ